MDGEKRIVDAHIHVWTDDFERYPLAPGFSTEDLWWLRFTPDDHFVYSRAVGNVRINLVQMTWYGLDHSYILDLIAGAPDTFVGTGIVPVISDVALPSPERVMVELSQGGIYAFRVRSNVARMPVGDLTRWLDYPGYELMFQAGAEHNLALSFLMSYSDLPDLDRMCTKFPDTPVILDHVCGVRIKDGVLDEEGLKQVCAMAKHKCVMVKLGPLHGLSGAPAPFLDLLPLLEPVIDAFGPQRCMWESDSGGPLRMQDPLTDYPASIALIEEHADFLSASDKEYILYKTAENFFFNR